MMLYSRIIIIGVGYCTGRCGVADFKLHNAIGLLKSDRLPPATIFCKLKKLMWLRDTGILWRHETNQQK